jgi:hypothetical protein
VATGGAWAGDGTGGGVVPMRAVAHLRGHLHPEHPPLPHLWRLPLPPVRTSNLGLLFCLQLFAPVPPFANGGDVRAGGSCR